MRYRGFHNYMSQCGRCHARLPKCAWTLVETYACISLGLALEEPGLLADDDECLETTRASIRKAAEILQEKKKREFNKEWCRRFLKRHGFRQKTKPAPKDIIRSPEKVPPDKKFPASVSPDPTPDLSYEFEPFSPPSSNFHFVPPPYFDNLVKTTDGNMNYSKEELDALIEIQRRKCWVQRDPRLNSSHQIYRDMRRQYHHDSASPLTPSL